MSERSGLYRWDFLSGAAAGLALAGLATRPANAAAAERGETETLIAWGATHAFGIAGDGIGAPVVALTGLTFHDLQGAAINSVDTVR